MNPLFTALESALYGWSGSYWMIAFGLLAFFLIFAFLAGLDFRFGLLLIIPLGLAIVSWLSPIYSFIFWAILLVFGVYMAINTIRERM